MEFLGDAKSGARLDRQGQTLQLQKFMYKSHNDHLPDKSVVKFGKWVDDLNSKLEKLLEKFKGSIIKNVYPLTQNFLSLVF